MRTIFVIGLVLVCAFMAGWFTVNRDDGQTTIRIDRNEIRNDARAAINRGKDYLHDGISHDHDRPQGQLANQPLQMPQGQQNWQGQQQYNYPQGQAVPANWAQQGGQPVQLQPPMQLQQPNNQQPSQGFYYPDTQHANRPPAPWNQPAVPQQQQPRQY